MKRRLVLKYEETAVVLRAAQDVCDFHLYQAKYLCCDLRVWLLCHVFGHDRFQYFGEYELNSHVRAVVGRGKGSVFYVD